MYENLAAISGGRLGTDGDIKAVHRDKQRQKSGNKVERKLLREKQFNRQVELNGELRQLKRKLRNRMS